MAPDWALQRALAVVAEKVGQGNPNWRVGLATQASGSHINGSSVTSSLLPREEDSRHQSIDRSQSHHTGKRTTMQRARNPA